MGVDDKAQTCNSLDPHSGDPAPLSLQKLDGFVLFHKGHEDEDVMHKYEDKRDCFEAYVRYFS